MPPAPRRWPRIFNRASRLLNTVTFLMRAIYSGWCYRYCNRAFITRLTLRNPMKVSEMNWQHLERYLSADDRAIVPLGSTEQHAFLSLSVDSILAEKVAVDAAELCNVPVFPVMPFGMTPTFCDYPGTISLSMQTYVGLLYDIL